MSGQDQEPASDRTSAARRREDNEEAPVDYTSFLVDGELPPALSVPSATVSAYDEANNHFMLIPYTEKKNGLGVNLNRGKTKKVLASYPGCHSARFNEPNNIYGIKVTVLTIRIISDEEDAKKKIEEDAKKKRAELEDTVEEEEEEEEKESEERTDSGELDETSTSVAKRKNDTGTEGEGDDDAADGDAEKDQKPPAKPSKKFKEEEPFNKVMLAEIDNFTQSMYLEPEPVIRNRWLELSWKVWGGFNKDTPCNPILKEGASLYAMYRIGLKISDGDELISGIHVVKELLGRHTQGSANAGNGSWMMPILVVFNYHLEHHTPFRKIQFSERFDIDEYLRTHNRRENSKFVEIKKDRDTTRAYIESDPTMRNKMLAYLNKPKRKYKMPKYKDVPANEIRVDEPRPRKRRRSLQNNMET